MVLAASLLKREHTDPGATPPADPRILVIDANAARLGTLISYLHRGNKLQTHMTSARGWSEAQIAMSMQTFDVVFIDWDLAWDTHQGALTSGFEAMLHGPAQCGVIIAMADQVTPSVRADALDAGAVACIQRSELSAPFLRQFIDTAVPSHRLTSAA